MKQKSKSLIILSLVPVVVTIVSLGVFVGLAFALRLDRSGALEGLAWTIGVMSIATVSLMLWWVGRSSILSASLGFRRLSWRLLHVLWQAPLVLLGALLTQVFFAAVFNLSPSESAVNTTTLEVSTLGAVILLASAIILVPIWEEVVFRGVVFNALRQRYRLPFSLILASAIFAIAHIAFPIFPYLFMLGLGLCLVYAFHRNTWASIIVHAFVNLVASAAVLSALTS